jgi:hypothetical protein
MPSASWPKKDSPFLNNSEKLVRKGKKVIVIQDNFQRFLVFDNASRSCYATWNFLRTPSLPLSDACRPSPWSDAHITWRALFEPFDKAQAPRTGPPSCGLRPSTLMRLGGASMVLGPFPPHKGCALRDAPSDGCALRDAPSNKLGCRAETRHLSHMLLTWQNYRVH